MKKTIFIQTLIIIILLFGCSKENIKLTGNWKKAENLNYIKRIQDNNAKIKSFKAVFYMTENKKRMALNGKLFFDSNSHNFLLTLTDVLVSSKILTMKKYNDKLLLYFHKDNAKHVENIHTVNLSTYNFLFELNDLILFISLKIPLIDTKQIYYQLNNNIIIYMLNNEKTKQLVFINKNTSKVEKIEYYRNNNKYAIKYINYNKYGNFHYPDYVKLLNYSQRQRIMIKLESINFVDKIPIKKYLF